MDTAIMITKTELDEWRLRIEAAWQRSVESVIEVGRLVKQAKDELGVSFALLETELPFSSTVAAFLIKIAEHPVLSNPIYFSKLPNSYNALYYLASVDEETLVEQLESGEISPDYTITSARTLKAKKPASFPAQTKGTRGTLYEVGTIRIGSIQSIEKFQAELEELLNKYSGSITYTHKQDSIFELHRGNLLNKALARISKAESELNATDLEELRLLEDAAHYLSKKSSPKAVAEILIKGTFEKRECLPDDYKDLARLRKILGIEHITRGQLKKYCIDNKIPNQFTENSRMDKELYVWEQVRLIVEKKDADGGLKRLRDLVARSTVPHIKVLAQSALDEVMRFENKE